MNRGPSVAAETTQGGPSVFEGTSQHHPRAVVIGPAGAGKTTIAQRLAGLLNVAWVDTDQQVENVEGSTIAEIFHTSGEDTFRRLEAETVRTALEECSGIVSLGGGAIADPRTRELLRRYADDGGHVIYVEVEYDEVEPRITRARHRPLLLTDARSQWQRLMDERRPHYEAVKTTTIKAGGRSSSELAAEIVAVLSEALPNEEAQ